MALTLNIRCMQPADLELALDWAAQEGWNPGLHDAATFYATDPMGFWVAELEGEPIGCISTVRYSDQFGFVGLYIVRPQWRGQGYGLRLWQTALQNLTHRLNPNSSSIGLDAVLERESNYRQAGFNAAYNHIRQVYHPLEPTPLPGEVIPLAQMGLEAIAHYDAQLFPAARPQFLEPWIQNAEAAYGVIEQNRLVGYGILRRCREGFKIGPLFAQNVEVADCLFRALTHHNEGKPVFIDIPDVNPALHHFIKRYQLQPVFTCVRMYRGEPHFNTDHIFGVTTLELG